MDYQGNVIRPPSEADSIILQVTVGCSHNKCTFCGAYKDVRFKIKDEDVIIRDLQYAAQHFQRIKKIFLADGDVLILSHKRLTAIIAAIKKYLPWVNRIRVYGNSKAILTKSVDELIVLKEMGVDRIYMGLESGDDEILASVEKWGNSAKMIEAAARVKAAAIFLSVTVLLGLGGIEKSTVHARETAKVLNRMQPNQIAALTLMLIPGTPMFSKAENNEFKLPGPAALLRELKTILEGLNLDKTMFQANHASNYLPIDCRLRRDKEKVLGQIDLALAGAHPLMPEYMRGL